MLTFCCTVYICHQKWPVMCKKVNGLFIDAIVDIKKMGLCTGPLPNIWWCCWLRSGLLPSLSIMLILGLSLNQASGVKLDGSCLKTLKIFFKYNCSTEKGLGVCTGLLALCLVLGGCAG